MENTKKQTIKIGGKALDTIQHVATTSYRTLKGSAEMLILMGKERLDELNKLIEEQRSYNDKHFKNPKTNKDEK